MTEPQILISPQLTVDQLFNFYERNGICEIGFGKEVAARILEHPHVIVAALDDDQLVGLARATFDGLSAAVMEFSVDLGWQGAPGHQNGSLVNADVRGLGRAMGEALLSELRSLGCTFVSGYIVEGCEEEFYSSLGFRENVGHRVYYIDARPYVTGKQAVRTVHGGPLSSEGRSAIAAHLVRDDRIDLLLAGYHY